MNAQQAAAYAMANGAELEIDGRVINKDRQVFKLDRKPAPAAAPAPLPAAVAPDVDAKLADQELRLVTQMRDLASAIGGALANQQPAASSAPPRPVAWDFAVEYGPKLEIVNIRATPVQ